MEDIKLVTDLEAFMHLLKAALGTGLYAMGVAFYSAGLFLSIALTALTGVIVAHCCNLLVKSALQVSEQMERTGLTYPEVAEGSCIYGPPWANKMATGMKIFTLINLFVAYYLTLSCYTVISARTLNYALEYFLGEAPEIRLVIAALILPEIILIYVPHYKYMAPVSIVANIFMLVGLIITFYHMLCGLPAISERDAIGTDIVRYPTFITITVFGMMFVGVILPLANQMKTPEHLVSGFGIMNIGLAVITLLNISIGFVGYWRYGSEVEGTITLNLPEDHIESQVTNILIGLAVFLTLGVQFFVTLELIWTKVKDRYAKNKLLVEYLIRTALIVSSAVLAVAAPFIVPFVSLISAMNFSFLGLILPIVLYRLLHWSEGWGFLYWKLFKDLFILIVGIIAFIFGTLTSIYDIIDMYQNEEKTTTKPE